MAWLRYFADELGVLSAALNVFDNNTEALDDRQQFTTSALHNHS